MKITRRQLNNLIRESIDREKLVRYIANELANRAADMGMLDDINDADSDALDFTLPEVLVSKLGPDPSQAQWTGLAKAIAQGTYDSDLAEIADPEEDDDPDLDNNGMLSVGELVKMTQNIAADVNESKMKITRRKLRSIIKEELGRLPKSSIAHGPGEAMHTINSKEEAQSYVDQLMSALTVSQKDLATGNKGKNDTQRDQQDEALLNDLMLKMDLGIYPFDIPLGIRS